MNLGLIVHTDFDADEKIIADIQTPEGLKTGVDVNDGYFDNGNWVRTSDQVTMIQEFTCPKELAAARKIFKGFEMLRDEAVAWVKRIDENQSILLGKAGEKLVAEYHEKMALVAKINVLLEAARPALQLAKEFK